MNIIHCAATHRTSSMAAKKLIYPAADRNKEPILSVLKRFVRRGADQACLEIASGSGQHVAHFAPHFPQVTFYPSEYDGRLLDSIRAHSNGLSNVAEPSAIDIAKDPRDWHAAALLGDKHFDYIYCANMIHISPYSCTVGLFKNAGVLLKKDGLLVTYGPYAIGGAITPESNVKFDESLKSQNPEWGIRDIGQLEVLAGENGIRLVEIVDMPANNKTVIWRKE